jgi:energy-coupling factor transport system ATP-binding protein
LALIGLSSLSYTYPGASRPALDGINLSIEEGEYLAIVGKNGSGKSTLIRLLDGLRLPTSGDARILGLDPRDRRNDRALRSGVALVFQAPLDQIVSSVVEEDTAFGPENLGLPRHEMEARVGASLAAVGLEGMRRRPSLFLSAGQQQRLAIAGALAMDPSCIAFDEATAMLDPQARVGILDLIDSLVARGLTVVHATHDMAEAARAGRVIVLEAGRLVFDGRPEELFLPQAGKEARAVELGLGLPQSVLAASALGLEARLAEGPASLASRCARSRGGGGRSGAASAAAALDAGAMPDTGQGTDSAEPAFSLSSAGYAYLKGTSNEVTALEGANLVVPKGSLVALVGETGSGKSTVLQLLDGLAFPKDGRVLAFGEDTSLKSTDLRALRMRAPLAVQRPESALFEPYAGDDVAFGPRNGGLSGKALVERVRSSMERLGLPFAAYRDRGTRGLSGGEKRRLALAGILALDPEAFLLDEPTSALDPETKASVLALVKELSAQGRTVVFATHSMEEAAMADFVAVLRGGRMVAFDRPATIFHDRYDGAWGIGRPFACELAFELGRLGLPVPGRPLDLPGLARSLCGLPADQAAPDGEPAGESGARP